jgi:hypothetical protein
MFMMFDFTVWMSIITTFLIGAITIAIFSLTTQKVQDAVFGERIQAPLLNLVSVFLHGATIREPSKSFPR